MDRQELLKQIPRKRIKAYDGMSVTADAWEEAHEHALQQLRMHVVLQHVTGIVSGLEVIASDPPDSSVYILPGIAVDSLGRVIVVPEAMAYDLGDQAQGLLYLLISYAESRPTAGEGTGREGDPLYIYSQFIVDAQSTPAEGPWVELARLVRQGRGKPITDAQDSAYPQPNELDMRFRQGSRAVPPAEAGLAVIHLGKKKPDRRHGRGVAFLGQELGNGGRLHLWVDEQIPLDADLGRYTLVYLVGEATFALDRDEMTALYNYLQAGGTVLYESCRHGLTGGESPADVSFNEVLTSMGVRLGGLPAGAGLLSTPNLFAVPPAGFETQGQPNLLLGGGVIHSTYDYGCLWQGERRSGPASRDEIRTAFEWGHNLLAYAMDRRAKAQKK